MPASRCSWASRVRGSSSVTASQARQVRCCWSSSHSCSATGWTVPARCDRARCDRAHHRGAGVRRGRQAARRRIIGSRRGRVPAPGSYTDEELVPPCPPTSTSAPIPRSSTSSRSCSRSATPRWPPAPSAAPRCARSTARSAWSSRGRASTAPTAASPRAPRRRRPRSPPAAAARTRRRRRALPPRRRAAAARPPTDPARTTPVRCRLSTAGPGVHSLPLIRGRATRRGQHGGVPRFRRPRSPVQLLRQITAGALACLALGLALRPPPSAAGDAAPPTVPITVAAADLPAGTVLTAADLRVVDLPEDAAPAGAAASPDEVTGQVLAAPLRTGAPVTDVRVVGPGLWSQVPDGLVAAPVRLADLAVAGLLRAGDRVDVLAAGQPPDATDGAPAAFGVVAADALVLTAPTNPAGDAAGSGADGGPDGGGLLVLAVPPDTAQRLAATGATATLTVTLGRP